MRYFVLILLLTALAIIGMAGCRGGKSRRPPLYIFPDMKWQPRPRPQTTSGFFDDGRSSRRPVAGTIPRSEPLRVGDRLVYAWQDSPVNTGRASGTTNFIDNIPLPVTAQLVQRGRELFDINCAACHGRLGDGNAVPKRIGAMLVVANLHDKRIVELADGELFNTISNGKNLMPSYAANLAIQDRWSVVAYLRALQLSQLGAINDLPGEFRDKFR